MKIYKYSLVAFPTKYAIPVGAQFLCVQTQYNQPQMWFLVDPNVELTSRKFIAVGTGQEFDVEGGTYLGTFQLDGGALVFHLFEYV